jgi:hypothetical protein
MEQDSETVQSLLALVKSDVTIWRSDTNQTGDARTLCEGYTDESYASMNQDVVRNTFFKRCIDYTVKQSGHSKWTQLP